jgi:hypothetical protein
LSRRRPTLLAAWLIATVAASGASAYDDVSVSGALTGDYLYNTDVEASAFDCRLELDAGVGPVRLGVVYRAYQLTDPTYNPSGVDLPGSEIKHRFAELEQETLSARVGHFFSTFGHGLTLRSYEDVDLEHDTALDGLLAEVRAGDVTVIGLSGVTTEPLSDGRRRDHPVRAARVSVPVLGWATAAATAVQRSRLDRLEDGDVPDADARFEDSVIGVGLDAWAGPLTLTAEYAGRSGENPADGSDVVQGSGVYAASTVELGRFTLFGEFKDYDDFDHYLVNPPTCVREHVWTLMNRATYEVDLGDERGFLAEGSALVGESAQVTGGASEARSHDGGLSHWEIFGKAEHDLSDGVGVGFGASWSREYVRGKFFERRIGAFDLDVTLPSGDIAELSLEGQLVDDPASGEHEDYIAAVTFYPGTGLTFSFVLEATTDKTSDRGAWSTVHLRALVLEDTEVTLAVGSERGGKKCSGGVCYVEPEFEGARLKLSKFF